MNKYKCKTLINVLFKGGRRNIDINRVSYYNLFYRTHPNLTKNQEVASQKGCEATIALVNTQIIAYQIENNHLPVSLSELEGVYIQNADCPDGTKLRLDGDKAVIDDES